MRHAQVGISGEILLENHNGLVCVVELDPAIGQVIYQNAAGRFFSQRQLIVACRRPPVASAPFKPSLS
jgi:hypothetical protein